MKDNFEQIIAGCAVLQSVPAQDRRMAFDALPEVTRVNIIRSAGAVPDACGADIPAAPARGPVRAFDYLGSYPEGDAASILKPAGYMGRKSLQCLDVFGRMAAQSRRKGGSPLLTDSQIGMGRIYRSLIEDRDAGAVRCSSLEATRAGGGSQEGFTDHRLAQSRRIDTLQARVGAGVAMTIRRIRPSARNTDLGAGARLVITDRVLVDAVCLTDRDISAVLRAHGWAVKGDTVRAATDALAAALDRMIGPIQRPAIRVVHFGQQSCELFSKYANGQS
jgi:hypothetical protein